MNAQLEQNSRVERVYWSISPIVASGVLDAVRTNLVELVAEMRAGTPFGVVLPSREGADHAVQVVVKGDGNRVVVNSVGTARDVATTVGGTTSTGSTQAESRPRRLAWWIFGSAATLGAVATVIAVVR